MDYEIRNLEELESKISELREINKATIDYGEILATVLTGIKRTWKNESGADIQSIITELDSCVKTLHQAICPTNSAYITAMDRLAKETRINQNKSI